MKTSQHKTLCARYAAVLKDLISQKHIALKDVEALYSVCEKYTVEISQKTLQSNATAQAWVLELAQKLKLAPPIKNFLGLLAQHRRFGLMPDIYKLFHEHLLQDKGVQIVTITTASPLEKSIVHEVESRLGGVDKVRVIMRHRPEILGGFILCCGHDMMDLSYAYYLHSLRTSLIKD